ncbi:MAG: ATP-binding protein [Candidatus Heimdallarchaeota archaeon]
MNKKSTSGSSVIKKSEELLDKNEQIISLKNSIKSLEKQLEITSEMERTAFVLIADAMSKHTDISKFCIEILRDLRTILKYDYGCIRTLNNDKSILELRGIIGFPKELAENLRDLSLIDDKNIMVYVVNNRKTITSADVFQETYLKEFYPNLKQFKIKSGIASPLLGTNKEPVGCIQFSSSESKTLSIREKKFFETITGVLANAIEKLLAEEALAKAYKEREELNRIINASSAIVVLWRNEPNWPVEFISDNVASQWGYTPEEFYTGKINYYDIVPEEDAKFVDKKAREISKKKIPKEYNVDYRVRTKENKMLWITGFSSVRKNSKGKITHYRSILFDITERKSLAEKQRRERQAFRIVAEAALFARDLQSLARAVLIGIMDSFEFDVGTIRLLDQKKQTLDLIADAGIKPRQKSRIAKSISINDPDYFVAYVARTKTVFYTPVVEKIALSDKHKERLEALQIKSQIAWPLLNSKQELIGTFVIGAYSHKALLKEDESLFETLAGMLSTALERMLGDQALKTSEEKLRVLNEKLEERVDERTKELQKTITELEEFSYTISHDLRTPLRGINGLTHLLNEEYSSLFDDQAKEYFTRIRKATTKMDVLIDALTNLSMISRFDLKLEEINLSAYAKVTFENIKVLYPDEKVKLQVKKNLKVHCDPHLIQMLLFNLLDNAFKFSKNSEQPLIVLGSKKQEKNTVYYIQDNGIGFDIDTEKIFKPFQRFHSSDEYSGFGIGLAIVKRIIEKHHGKIWIESKVNEGSTIYFTLKEI